MKRKLSQSAYRHKIYYIDNYNATHKAKQRYYVRRSNTRMFIRNATLADLNDVEKRISARKAELKKDRAEK